MRKILKGLTGLAFIATTLAPPLATAGDQYFVYGLGNYGCESWLADRKSGDYLYSTQWLYGFITGVGAMGGSLHDIEVNEVTDWIDHHCRNHPLDTLEEASGELVKELMRKKHQQN